MSSDRTSEQSALLKAVPVLKLAGYHNVMFEREKKSSQGEEHDAISH